MCVCVCVCVCMCAARELYCCILSLDKTKSNFRYFECSFFPKGNILEFSCNLFCLLFLFVSLLSYVL